MRPSLRDAGAADVRPGPSVEPQEEFVDLGAAGLREPTPFFDEPEPALLEDAPRAGVVLRRPGEDRTRGVLAQQRRERLRRDPLAPVRAVDPVRELALPGR